MLNQIKITLLGFFLTIFQILYFLKLIVQYLNKLSVVYNFGNNNAQELSLEIADNEQKRSYGLMNRKDMKSNSGMLFIWKDRQIRNFWMKNTHFNLDLFFLNNQGEIIEIYKNAKAFDETNIKSQNKVNFVVELKSGEYPLLIGDKFNCPFKELLK